MWYRLLILVSLVTLCGCTPTGPGAVHGISDRSSSFTHIHEGSVPGLDNGTISVITMRAGPPAGVTFVVWTDTSNSVGHGGTSDSGANYLAEYHTHDGRQFTAQAETSDGISGTLTIDGTTYDLGDGALFLVSTQAGETTVSQIDIDVSNFPTDHEELKTVAEENPEIGEFFRSAVGADADNRADE